MIQTPPPYLVAPPLSALAELHDEDVDCDVDEQPAVLHLFRDWAEDFPEDCGAA